MTVSGELLKRLQFNIVRPLRGDVVLLSPISPQETTRTLEGGDVIAIANEGEYTHAEYIPPEGKPEGKKVINPEQVLGLLTIKWR